MLKRLFKKKTDAAPTALVAVTTVPATDAKNEGTQGTAAPRRVAQFAAKTLFPEDDLKANRKAGSCSSCSFPFANQSNGQSSGPCSGSFMFTYTAATGVVIVPGSVIPGCFAVSVLSVTPAAPTAASTVTIVFTVTPTSGCFNGFNGGFNDLSSFGCGSSPFSITAGTPIVSASTTTPAGGVVTATATGSGFPNTFGTLTVVLSTPAGATITTATVTVPVMVVPFRCFCGERSCRHRGC